METNNEVQTKENLTDNTSNETEIRVQIAIIMRQTTYTKQEAETLFDKLGSVEKCIEHYLGIEPKGEPNISTNQKIFKSIREFF